MRLAICAFVAALSMPGCKAEDAAAPTTTAAAACSISNEALSTSASYAADHLHAWRCYSGSHYFLALLLFRDMSACIQTYNSDGSTATTSCYSWARTSCTEIRYAPTSDTSGDGVYFRGITMPSSVQVLAVTQIRNGGTDGAALSLDCSYGSYP